MNTRGPWLAAIFLIAPEAFSAPRTHRYALLLEDEPLAAVEEAAVKTGSRRAVGGHRAKLDAAQASVRNTLDERFGKNKVRVTRSVSRVLNAVFVASAVPAGELKVPGVAQVIELEPVERLMVRAADLARVNLGWQAVGGEQNAGDGVRIAVLDTGIDHNHAAFRDTGFTAPAGFPRCRGAECDFTNNKVIAARSYVDLLVLAGEPEFSRPDDLSPRDRVGHGTAVAMVAAGVRHNTPMGMISGVAPRAYLGNYKIFGSPGVNDVTFDDAAIAALEDAVDDGMEIAVASWGRSALFGPNDTGRTCDRNPGLPCDVRATAVENAMRLGMTVVIAAGNNGDDGVLGSPAYNTIGSPGTAAPALTVGATTNSQRYVSSVRISGGNPPPALQNIPALFSEGPQLTGPTRFPVRDVAAQGGGRACSPLANGSLAGAAALIERGDCGFSTKITYAQQAGAAAVIIQQREGSDFIFQIPNLRDTAVPSVMIGATAGRALRQLIATGAAVEATLDPTLTTARYDPNFIATFSSFGPSIRLNAIKPEVSAPGDPLYMATQSFDPNGDMYSRDGYIAAEGTSFAAPFAAGVAALFKQRVRNAIPAQVKSAVVNTATNDVQDVDGQGRPVRASVLGAGAGKVNAQGAARTLATVEPATLSFGDVTLANATRSLQFRVNNHSSAAMNVRLEVRQGTSDNASRVTLSETQFTLNAGQARQITARIEGSTTRPGAWEGEVIVVAGETLRVPYLYLVGDNITDNAFALRNANFSADVGTALRLTLKLVDRSGLPVVNREVRFRAVAGDGRIDVGGQTTDDLGIAEARAVVGSQFGTQEFTAEAGDVTLSFRGIARLVPAIASEGIVNAASNQIGRGVAPGSYIAIFGRNLSDAFRIYSTPYLPLSLAGVSVSFDVPERRISLPGRIHFVSDSQVNVQVPWELQGFNQAMVKVSIGLSSSALFRLPLADASPALFEFRDPATGRMLAAALDEGFQLLNEANAASRGRVAQLYANGLGAVDNQPLTGETSPAAEPLARSRVLPTVTVGGRPAEVLFSGLAPGFVALYQLNVRLAADTPTGLQPVVVTVGGISSKAANLAVR